MSRKTYLLIISLWLLAAQLLAQPGSLDPDFLPNTLEMKGTSALLSLSASVLLPDQSLIIYKEGRLIRFNNQGVWDSNFHSFPLNMSAVKLKNTSDGKILARCWVNFNSDEKLVRFFSNGLVDSTFQISDSAIRISNLVDFKPKPDGKIIVSGRIKFQDEPYSDRLLALDANGNIDSSFTISNNKVEEIQVLPDGKLLAIKRNKLVRFMPDGSPDSGFQPPDQIALKNWNKIRALPDGHFLLGDLDSIRVEKINANGFSVSSFNPISIPFIRSNYDNSQMEVYPDGSFIITNVYPESPGPWSQFSYSDKPFIRRFFSNGDPDLSFELESNSLGFIKNIHPLADGSVIFTGYLEVLAGKAVEGKALVSAQGQLVTSFQEPNQFQLQTSALCVQPDQKILVGGFFNFFQGKERFKMARLEPDGKLDTTFVPPFSPLGGSIIKMEVLSNGKILVLRRIKMIDFQGFEFYIYHYSLEQYFSDGRLDTAFTNKFQSANSIHNFLVQPDGKILISCISDTLQSIPIHALARLLPDGQLDSSFSPVTLNMGGTGCHLTLQPDGKILYAPFFLGMTDGGLPLYRLLPNGEIDPDFVKLKREVRFNGILPLADGRILVYGNFRSINNAPRQSIAILQPNGLLDSTKFTGITNPFHCIQLPDGSVLVLARSKYWNCQGLYRFFLDGRYDSTFLSPDSYNGPLFGVFTDFHPSPRLALQPLTERILATGVWNNLLPDHQNGIAGFLAPQDLVLPPGKASGIVFQAKNNDCQADLNEIRIPYRVLVSQPGSYYALSNNQGQYQIPVDNGPFSIRHLLSDGPVSDGVIVDQVCPPDRGPQSGTNQPGDTLMNANFSLDVHDCGFLQTSVAAGFHRPCAPGQMAVLVRNSGFQPSSPQTRVQIKLPAGLFMVNSTHPFSFLPLDSVYQVELGSILPQAQVLISMTDSMGCNLSPKSGLPWIQARVFPENPCASQAGQWEGADLTVEGNCHQGKMRFRIQNKGTTMLEARKARMFLDSSLVFEKEFQLNSGDSLVLHPQYSGPGTLRLEVPQSANHPRFNFLATHIQCTPGTLERDWFSATSDYKSMSRNWVSIAEVRPVIASQVSPKGIGNQGLVLPERPLQYTIRFQGITKGVLKNVLVRSYLDLDFDLASFEPGPTSHPFLVTLSGKGRPVLDFMIDSISPGTLLTDSGYASGFVQFSLRPKKGLAIGTLLHHQSEISWEGQPPLRSNPVINTIYEPQMVTGLLDSVVVNPRLPDGDFVLFPNPADDWVVMLTSSISDLQVFDVLGRKLDSMPLQLGENNLNFSNYPRGMYLLKLTTENRTTKTHKLVLR